MSLSWLPLSKDPNRRWGLSRENAFGYDVGSGYHDGTAHA